MTIECQERREEGSISYTFQMSLRRGDIFPSSAETVVALQRRIWDLEAEVFAWKSIADSLSESLECSEYAAHEWFLKWKAEASSHAGPQPD